MSTIRLGTAAATRSFQELSTALRSPGAHFSNLIDSEALEDEFGRFRVWAGNLGALQKGHSSLDYRLRDSPLLSNNALKLLKELEENLSEALAVVSGTRLPYEQQEKPQETDEEEDDDGFYSEDEDDGSENGAPKTELDQRFREVVDIIDNLYKLSVRIRQPTLRTRSLKAASYRPKDPETGVDILEVYANFDLQHTQELIRHFRSSHVSEDNETNDILIDRLSKAITLRRRQFKYWRRHRDKLGISTLLEDNANELPPTVQRPETIHRHETHDTLEVQLDNQVSTAVKEVASEKTGKTLLSGTEATHHHQSLDDIVDSKSVTSYATTVRDLSGKGIELPPPPKAADGEKDFECPFCFIICPARYGFKRGWRTHLLQDLQPYVCTYAECDSPERLYRSRREWSEHEATHRKAWRCPEHPTAIYRARSGLEDHLRQAHSDSVTEHQLESIAKVGETSTVDVREKCPICFVRADELEGMGGLQNHIANHLERLASFSLPALASEDDRDGASSVASRGGSATSGSSQNLSQDLSQISFQSKSVSEGEYRAHDDIAASQELSTSTALEQTTSSLEQDITPGHGVLSAEALSSLPDSSQKRLDFLLPNEVTEDESDEQDLVEELAEVEEHLDEVQTFRTYLLSMPGAELVRFFRRFGGWRGYVIFKEDVSAAQALTAFDYARFPVVRIRQNGENRSTLTFNIDAAVKKTPSRQSTIEENDSLSSASVSYDEEQAEENDGKPSILSISEVSTLSALYKSRTLLQRDQSYASNVAYNQIISFCRYDITRLRVDCIVNSANRAMKTTPMSDSLNRRIHKAAGPELKKECKTLERAKEGDVRLTRGYNLPAQYIIHAARPQYAGSKGTGKLNTLTQCYRNALKAAMNHGITTIAFPCLAAGGCGFPSRVAARIALQEIREFLDVFRHKFERIIFCVYNGKDENAYKDFFPVFFPPTHRDLEDMAATAPSRDNASLANSLQDAYVRMESIAQELVIFEENMTDFPRSVLSELASIVSATRSLNNLLSSGKPISKLTSRAIEDVDLLCSVLEGVSSGVSEIVEQTTYTRNFGQPTHKKIWDDYNFHMKNSQGLDLPSLLEICQDFVQCLDDILVRDGIEPFEMTTMRIRLRSYRVKQTGQSEDSVREQFDETLYARDFHREEVSQSRSDTIKASQIRSIARLYQLGELEYRNTNAKPDSRQLYTVCLIREDITRLEVDVIVNSTDMAFAGMGTLDRTIFKKGGLSMQEDCSNFGVCKEGDVRVTQGYLLPCRHVIHTIPPETYRKNTKDILRKLYREVLYMAASLNATSVAIPAIGTGLLNYPRRDCGALAMEEIKRFLETEASHTLEKIILCVFGSNDEFIYKSILPIYFPPMDSNVNKALPDSSASIGKPTVQKELPSSAHDETSPPRRSLFGSIGEAFRNVRFGKQPVTETSRPPNRGEEHALINFELHARDCPTCCNILKVYNEGRSLCPDGYAGAQLILQYLYMESSQFVYSTNLEDGKRVRVEIPQVYPNCWNLLVTVERSFRDGHRSKPFVSPNQPYSTTGKEEQEAPPPGVTIHTAEFTIPYAKPLKETIAFLHAWSEDEKELTPLLLQPCNIRIYPGIVEVYAPEHKTEGPPLLSLILSLRISPSTFLLKSGSLDVAIKPDILVNESFDGKLKPGNELVFRSQFREACEELFQWLKHARRADHPHVQHEDVHKSSTPVSPAAPEATSLHAGSIPSEKNIEQAVVNVFTRKELDEEWEKLHPSECIVNILPGKLQIYELDADREADDHPLISLGLPWMVGLAILPTSITLMACPLLRESRIHFESMSRRVMLVSKTFEDNDALSRAIKAARIDDTSFSTNERDVDPSLSLASSELPSARTHEPSTRPSGPVSALTQQIQASRSSASPSTEPLNLPQRKVSRTVLARAEDLLKFFKRAAPQTGFTVQELADEIAISPQETINVVEYLSELGLAVLQQDRTQVWATSSTWDARLFSEDLYREEWKEQERQGKLNIVAKRVLALLGTLRGDGKGMHMRDIAEKIGSDMTAVALAGDDLLSLGLIRTTVDDSTWAVLDTGDSIPALGEQRPPEQQGSVDAEVGSGTWTCPHCFAKNPDLTPDVCPVCGWNRAALATAGRSKPRPSTSKLDLSISGLSTINIDDFFTYLDLALDPESSKSKSKEKDADRQRPLTRSKTFDPPLRIKKSPSQYHSSQYAEVEDEEVEEEEDDGIRHPRPTTPDTNQPKPIPPGARWTRIDRRIVNVKALEEANEQFEEREDSIIVLRVLSRKEIMKLAERTRDIRRSKEEEEEATGGFWRSVREGDAQPRDTGPW